MSAYVRLGGLASWGWALIGVASCAGAGGPSGDLTSGGGAHGAAGSTSAALSSSSASSASALAASASATSAPTAPQIAESAPLPPALDWPKESACELAAPSWPLEGSVRAALSPDGEPAFELAAGWNARVAIGEGTAEKAVITGEFSDAGITLRGHLKLEAVQLFASQPLLLGGVFIPDGTTPLRWHEATKGQATVSAEAPKSVRFVQPAKAEVGCNALSLSTSSFDGVQGAFTQEVIPVGTIDTPLVLLSGPEGKPVAHIDRDERTHYWVRRLDRIGAWSRLAVRVPNGDVIGWVLSSSISPSSGGTGRSGRRSSVVFGHVPVLESRVCPQQLPVIMTIGPMSRVIGSLDANTPFDLTAHGEALTGVHLRSKRLSARGGQFFARTSDLAECKPAELEAP